MPRNRHLGLPAPGAGGRLFLWPALAVLGATALYLWAWRDGPYAAGDTASYLEVARDLEDFRVDELPFRAVGYPLFLRLLGVSDGDEKQILVVQLALHMASVLLLAGLLGKLRVPPAGVLAFAIIGVLPPYTQMAAFVLSETLCEGLLVVGLVFAARWLAFDASSPELAAASLALALCGLTRPLYQAMPLVLALAALLALTFGPLRRHRRPVLIAAVALPCATLLIVGAFRLRDQARFGTSTSALFSFALSARMANYIEYADFEREDVREILVRRRDEALVSTRHHRGEGYIFQAFPELVEAYGGDEQAAARELTRLNLSVIRREPRNYLREVIYSLPRFWEPHSGGVLGMRSPLLAATWFLLQWLVAAAFLGLLALACIIAGWSRTLSGDRLRRLADRPAQLGRRRFWSLWLFGTAIAYNLGLSVTIGVGVPRYRAPTDLVVLASIAVGLSALHGVQRRFRTCFEAPARRRVDRGMP